MIPAERIERAILMLRGQRVMLDADLADLYGVETRVLTQAVGRNKDRFPADFMFRLTKDEFDDLKSQSVISRSGEWGGRRYPPYAFTEQGVGMLSSVLRSKRAVQVNIEIMRAFVRLRQLLASHADLARKVDALEKKYDAQFKVVFDAIRQLMTPPPVKKRGRIGFISEVEIMATVYRKTYTKPRPKNAETFARKGERLARWKDAKGKTRIAKLTTGQDGTERIIVEAATFTAKYRDGAGVVREMPTGCRTKDGALSVLNDLTDRAEHVRSGVLSKAQADIADHQHTKLADHIDAYGDSLRSSGVTDMHRKNTLGYLRRLAADCSFAVLADLDRSTLER